MKKIILLAATLLSSHASFCQPDVFMKLLENKLLCTDDRLVNFLETNGYSRHSNTFRRQFADQGEFYYSEIINDNLCYATYRTDSKREYERIKNKVQQLCKKETVADRSLVCNCNVKRMYNVQITFLDYLSKKNYYEIKLFQNDKFRHQEDFLWD
jgi:hypothetical protein